jgi:hypothetical protein
LSRGDPTPRLALFGRAKFIDASIGRSTDPGRHDNLLFDFIGKGLEKFAGMVRSRASVIS